MFLTRYFRYFFSLFVIAIVMVMIIPITCFGQEDSEVSGESATVTSISPLGICLVICIIILILNIVFIVWLYKDAKNRGMHNPSLWVLLVLIIGIIGLIIYLLLRNQGDFVACKHCGGKMLKQAEKCPHCYQYNISKNDRTINEEKEMFERINQKGSTCDFCHETMLYNNDTHQYFCPTCGISKRNIE